MGIFGRSKKPVKLIPNSMTAALVDAFGMDREKIDVMGLASLPGEEGPHWITEEELANGPSTKEILEELEQDPNVQAVLAVADLAISKSGEGGA